MGGGTFSHASYASFSSSTRGKSTAEIFTSRTLDPYLNPKGVKFRESRDSTDNPESTPVIVGLDVTGSMGMVADAIARQGLGVLFQGILDRKPVTDPHVMFMGIGDASMGDQAPLQVSQFEADNRIVEQLTKLWVEGGGGGNAHESYHLPWYFAAFHTVHDAMEKRGRRGYLFTIGDEETPEPLTREEVERVCGDKLEQRELSAADLLALAQRSYDVFHVVALEGSHCRLGRGQARVREKWNALMGQNVLYLEDHTKLAETIVTAIEVREGRDALTSAKAWGGDTARVVHEATKNLPKGAPRPRLGGPL